MHAQKKLLRLFFCTTMVSTGFACTYNGPMTAKSDKKPHPVTEEYHSEPIDFFGVFFEPGKPDEGMAILSSLSRTLGGAAESLEQDLKTISTFPPGTKFKVLGFTDSKECSAKECLALSLRRATLVHEWLVENGVPRERLEEPEGYGSSQPIGDNATGSGRAKNRRAYIVDRPPN